MRARESLLDPRELLLVELALDRLVVDEDLHQAIAALLGRLDTAARGRELDERRLVAAVHFRSHRRARPGTGLRVYDPSVQQRMRAHDAAP